MSLQRKIPVEPLDDERLTNIERRLVVAASELRAPSVAPASRASLALAGVALAAALAGVAGWRLRGDDRATAPGDAVHTLSINTDREHTVQLGDDALGQIALTSGAATDLRVERTRARVVVHMNRGSIALHVEHRPGRVVMVEAGDTQIEDVGTRFSVDYDGNERLEVRVTEGEVAITHAGTREALAAGFAWTRANGARIPLAELEAATPRRGDPPGEGAADARHATTALAASGASGPEGDAAPRTAHAGSGAGGARRDHGATGRSNARKALREARLDPPEDVGTTDAAIAVPRYLALLAQMAESDDQKWASISRLHYSIAYVEHQAKHDEAALRHLRGVLVRGEGAAYRSALWLDVRIRCLAAFDDECRRSVELYRQRFPDGMHTGVADAIRAELGRR